MAKFKPGQSGNRAGRPKGIRDRRHALADALGERGDELLDKAIERALAGDAPILTALLARLIPPVRPTRAPVKVAKVKANATPSEIAAAVARAAARGELPSDVAADLTTALASIAKLRDVDEEAGPPEPVQIIRRTVDGSQQTFTDSGPNDPE